ncbi:MAG: hypothetical protein WC393_02295 [Candidatus Nanoarchaeia archaeon]|jgi:hypothetical protein
MVKTNININKYNFLANKIIHPTANDYELVEQNRTVHNVSVGGLTILEALRQILYTEYQFNNHQSNYIKIVDTILNTEIEETFNNMEKLYSLYFKQKYSQKTIGSDILNNGNYFEIKQCNAGNITQSLPFNENMKNVNDLDSLLLVYDSQNPNNTPLEKNGHYCFNMYKNKPITIDSFNFVTTPLTNNLKIDELLYKIKNTDEFSFKTLSNKNQIEQLYNIYKNFRNNPITAGVFINIQDIAQGIRTLITPKLKKIRPKAKNLFEVQPNQINFDTYENYYCSYAEERMLPKYNTVFNPFIDAGFSTQRGNFSDITTLTKNNFKHIKNWENNLSENLKFVLYNFESMLQYERVGNAIDWTP